MREENKINIWHRKVNEHTLETIRLTNRLKDGDDDSTLPEQISKAKFKKDYYYKLLSEYLDYMNSPERRPYG